MKLSKTMKKVWAYLCVIALVVSSITVSQTKSVNAAELESNGATYTVGATSGNITGFVSQGAFDGVRFGFAWGDAAVKTVAVQIQKDGEIVEDLGAKANGLSIYLTDFAALEAGDYTIVFTSTDDDTKVQTVDLTISGEVEVTTEAPYVDGAELLKDTAFVNGEVSNWNEYADNGAVFTNNGDGSVSVVVPAVTAGDSWAHQLVQNGLTITQDKWYVATITVTSDVDKQIKLLVQSDGAAGGTWAELAAETIMVAAGETETITLKFQQTGATEKNRVLFGVMMGFLGTAADEANVTISNVSLKTYTDEPTDDPVVDPEPETTTEAPAEPEEPATGLAALKWELQTAGTNGFEFSEYDGTGFTVANIPANADKWSHGARLENIPVTAGQTYIVSFTMTSTVDKVIPVEFTNGVASNKIMDVTAEGVEYSYKFTAAGDTVKLYMPLGYDGAVDGAITEAYTVTVSNVQLVESEPDEPEEVVDYASMLTTDANLAYGKTAAGSNHKEGNTDHNVLVDGTWNLWNGNYVGVTTPGYFEVDLGQIYESSSIDAVVIWFRNGDPNLYPRNGFKVQFGDVTFETVATVTSADYPDGASTTQGDGSQYMVPVVIDKDSVSGNVKKVRIQVDDNVGWGTQITEIAVISENPVEGEEAAPAENAAAVTVSSEKSSGLTGEIKVNITAGENQDGYTYYVYLDNSASAALSGCVAGEDYTITGVSAGTHTVKVVSFYNGGTSEGIISDPVEVKTIISDVTDPSRNFALNAAWELLPNPESTIPSGSAEGSGDITNGIISGQDYVCPIKGTDGAYYIIDLGKEVDASLIESIIVWYRVMEPGCAPDAANSQDIKYSTDKETWTDVVSVPGADVVAARNEQGSAPYAVTADVSAAEGTVRYIQIYYPKGVAYGAQVTEIGVFGETGVEPEEPETTEAPSDDDDETTTPEESSDEPVVEAPAAPEGLQHSPAADGSLPHYFAWAAVDGAESYNIYVNGELVAASVNAGYDLAAYVSEAGEYTIEVTAVAAGLESEKATVTYTVEGEEPEDPETSTPDGGEDIETELSITDVTWIDVDGKKTFDVSFTPVDSSTTGEADPYLYCIYLDQMDSQHSAINLGAGWNWKDNFQWLNGAGGFNNNYTFDGVFTTAADFAANGANSTYLVDGAEHKVIIAVYATVADARADANPIAVAEKVLDMDGEDETTTPEESSSDEPVEPEMTYEDCVVNGDGDETRYPVGNYKYYVGAWNGSTAQIAVDPEDADHIKVKQLSSLWHDAWGLQVEMKKYGLTPGETYTISVDMTSNSTDGKVKTSASNDEIPIIVGTKTLERTMEAGADGSVDITVGLGWVGLNVEVDFSNVVVKDSEGNVVAVLDAPLPVEPETSTPEESSSDDTTTVEPSTEAPSTEAPTTEAPTTEAPTTTLSPEEEAKLMKAPGKVTIKKATKKAKKLSVKFAKVQGATAYEVAVYTTKKLAKKNNTEKAIVYKDVAKVKVALKSKKIKKAKKLFVRVRAFVDVRGYKKVGKWSKVKKVK